MDGLRQYGFSDATAWGDRRKRRILGSIFDRVVPELEAGARIVEAGPGRGEFAELARDRGFEYAGIEPSDALRAELTAKGFFVVDEPLPDIQLDDRSTDLVYSFDVVEHLGTHLDVLRFFNESRRILKLGGHLVAIVPNCETMGPLFNAFEYQHTFVTTAGRIEHLLADAGFEHVRTRKFFTPWGLSASRVVRGLDRVAAHVTLLFGRSPLVMALVRTILGRNLSFRITKNLADHVAVVGRRAAKEPGLGLSKPAKRAAAVSTGPRASA